MPTKSCLISSTERKRMAAREEDHVNLRRRLVDLPIDVLIEIFLFLEPVELLYLSRTTKWLRAFLLSRRKSSASWKNAIDNVGLPPCPDWMSPPAYVFLAFDPVCHVGRFSIIQTLRGEFQANCFLSHRDAFVFAKLSIGTCGYGPQFVYRTMSSYCGSVKKFRLPRSTMPYTLTEINDNWQIVEHYGPYCFSKYSRSDWELVQTWERPEEVSLQDFVTQKNTFWRSIEEHAKLCRAWEHRQLEKRLDQLLFLKKRVKDIKTTVTKMGWSYDTLASFCDRPDFRELPQVKKFEQFTPQEWIEIGPQLICWLQEAFYDECRETLHDSILSLTVARLRDTSSSVRPKDVDVATIPAVRSVIEDHIMSNMSDWDLKTGLQPVLFNAFKNWSADAVEELKQMARKDLDFPPRSKPSSLLPVIFRCKTCHQGLRFNDALSHEHLYEVRPKEHSTCSLRTYERFLRGYSIYPRNTQVLQADVAASRRVENLVRQFGRNPSKVTYEELSPSTRKVVCNLCPPEVATGMIFIEAFEHCLHAHSEQNETEMWAV
ncbi:hypothetical protein JVU11DRAFT_878 [Chiua virens]|nr:hypothetical protein JVU11DRAFT_878 [Chiua virens]